MGCDITHFVVGSATAHEAVESPDQTVHGVQIPAAL